MDPGAAKAMVERMTAGEFDILVATQAAAKGHDFPNLTLVGVVDADLGLRGGDLRAAERTFQLLTQVAGRAGRRERPGHALVQTYAPEHPVLQAIAATDREAFVEAELEAREAAGLPPFTRSGGLDRLGPGRWRAGRLHRRHGAGGAQCRGRDRVRAGGRAARPDPGASPQALPRARRAQRSICKAISPPGAPGSNRPARCG